MNKFQEIKAILKADIVIQHYLGLPEKHNSTGNWYKSPFRKEKTASFCVSNKGIHDFGDSMHYDIISFVQKYFNTTPSKAIEILSIDFNLNLENEYENEKIIAILKQQREEQQEMKRKIEKWFYTTFKRLCEEYRVNLQAVKILKGKGYTEALNILYLRDIKLDMLIDEFICADETKKERMYLGRGDIEIEL